MPRRRGTAKRLTRTLDGGGHVGRGGRLPRRSARSRRLPPPTGRDTARHARSVGHANSIASAGAGCRCCWRAAARAHPPPVVASTRVVDGGGSGGREGCHSLHLHTQLPASTARGATRAAGLSMGNALGVCTSRTSSPVTRCRLRPQQRRAPCPAAALVSLRVVWGPRAPPRSARGASRGVAVDVEGVGRRRGG